MGYYTPIPGTWAWNDLPRRPLAATKLVAPLWYHKDSAHSKTLARLGHSQWEPDDPFIWSTALGGLFGQDTSLRGWKAAGGNLRQWVQYRNMPLMHRNFIGHSYGGCVLAFAAWNGLRMNTVITVGTPHHDLAPWDVLIDACERWLIIEDIKGDRMNRWGEWLDATFGTQAAAPLHAKIQVLRVPGIDHSRCLTVPADIETVWEREGAARWLNIPPAETAA